MKETVTKVKFISWNVNGFRACLTKGFADFFKEADADFVCLQETKMQEGQAQFTPEGYYQYWYSAEKKGYSGTCIFAKHEPLSVRRGLGIKSTITKDAPSLWNTRIFTFFAFILPTPSANLLASTTVWSGRMLCAQV